MKVLYWRWNSFMRKGVEQAFTKLHIDYDAFDYQPTDWEQDDRFMQQLTGLLNRKNYDGVFSINYHPLISEVCKEKNLAYFSWIYDAPIHIRNLEPMKYEQNHIYTFDRGQIAGLRKLGIKVSYMPLAADITAFQKTAEKQSRYESEISMVGQLYESEYAYYLTPLDEYMRGYLEAVLSAQMRLYGAYFLPELLTDDLLDKLNGMYDKASAGTVQIEKRELEFMLAKEITSRERKVALTVLARNHQVSLYSNDKNVALPNVKADNYVDYYTKMPVVFASSRINLNITLKCIQTGIPLRILDILAGGGFLITNYQAELEEYFKLGEDIVIYQELEELPEIADFYLKHETERRHVCERGKDIIEKKFTFEDRLGRMLCLG